MVRHIWGGKQVYGQVDTHGKGGLPSEQGEALTSYL